MESHLAVPRAKGQVSQTRRRACDILWNVAKRLDQNDVSGVGRMGQNGSAKGPGRQRLMAPRGPQRGGAQASPSTEPRPARRGKRREQADAEDVVSGSLHPLAGGLVHRIAESLSRDCRESSRQMCSVFTRKAPAGAGHRPSARNSCDRRRGVAFGNGSSTPSCGIASWRRGRPVRHG